MTTPAADLLLNREIGLIEFNRRVLAQAEDPAVPLLERLRFYVLFHLIWTNYSKSGWRGCVKKLPCGQNVFYLMALPRAKR